MVLTKIVGRLHHYQSHHDWPFKKMINRKEMKREKRRAENLNYRREDLTQGEMAKETYRRPGGQRRNRIWSTGGAPRTTHQEDCRRSLKGESPRRQQQIQEGRNKKTTVKKGEESQGYDLFTLSIDRCDCLTRLPDCAIWHALPPSNCSASLAHHDPDHAVYVDLW